MATVTPFPTPDAAFARTVHTVAAKVRATFPALGGKIDHALALVLAGAVAPAPARGPQAFTVAAQSDPTGLTVYDVTCGTPATCTCEDFTRQAPRETDYRCKHILATWIYRRALKQQEPTPVTSAALPEAAFSITLKGTMRGHEVLLTARGATWEEFSANVAQLSGLLDAAAPRASASPTPTTPTPETPVCPTHGPLKPSPKVPGTFFCPKKLYDGSYCKTRWPQS